MTAALPPALLRNPRLDRWLRIDPGGWVEVRVGKVELGQGILTALAQVAAAALGVDPGRVRMLPARTGASPDEGVTSGSLSIQDSGAALRQVCTEARAIYLAEAARRGAPGGTPDYWALADDALLAREATGLPPAVPVAGGGLSRIDLPDKVFGRPRFIHDLRPPGLLHGRMLRPPGVGSRLLAPGVAPNDCTVVRDGSLLGVLAESERDAERGAAALAEGCAWSPPDALPDPAGLADWLRRQPAETTRREGGERRDTAVRTLAASFDKPYLAHASIGPCCALAQWEGERLTVWTHSQGIYNLRRDLALALRIEPGLITVQHVEGAGCYGHNPADDVAFDAAFLARAAEDRPVRVQWSRADELAWTPFSPAMSVLVELDVDADGAIAEWRHTIWSNGHGTRPGRGTSPALLGAWSLAEPFERQAAVNAPLASGGGADRNAQPSYDVPAWSVTDHRVLSMPLRASAMRSLGALLNVFAAEQMMDRLARETATDPLALRRRHLRDERALAVLDLAAARSGWGTALPEGFGRGLAYARYKGTGAYCAVVARIEATDVVRVRRLVVACDVGLVVDPDGVANQLEGGAIQAASWVLLEAVRFEDGRVTSTSWDDYPILRFSDIPAVEVHVVPSLAPSVGAGEGSVGPTAAAIANAVHAALGVQVRRMPLSPDHVLAAFEERAGV